MKQEPSRVVLGDPQLTLKLHRADARRMGGNEVGRPKPLPDWEVSPMHEGAGQRRCLAVTLPAFKPLVLGKPPASRHGTVGTNEPLRPATLDEVLVAHFIVMKLGCEFQNSSRITRSAHPGKATLRG
mgnify:CR=1 FL=1